MGNIYDNVLPIAHVFSIHLKMRLSRDAQWRSQTLRLKTCSWRTRHEYPSFRPRGRLRRLHNRTGLPAYRSRFCSWDVQWPFCRIFSLYKTRTLQTLCTKRSVILRRVQVPVSTLCLSFYTFCKSFGPPRLSCSVYIYILMFVYEQKFKTTKWLIVI